MIIETVLIVEIVLDVLIVKVVLTIPVCLCELTVLAVPVDRYHLAVSAFCCVVALSLAKGAKPDPASWWYLRSSVFSAHHHRVTSDATISTLLSRCVGLYLWW